MGQIAFTHRLTDAELRQRASALFEEFKKTATVTYRPDPHKREIAFEGKHSLAGRIVGVARWDECSFVIKVEVENFQARVEAKIKEIAEKALR